MKMPQQLCCVGNAEDAGEEEDNFQYNFLLAHNKYRELHGAPPLRTSQKLADYAQEWAEHLANCGIVEHRRECPYGENIYVAIGKPVTGFEPVKAWYRESLLCNSNTSVDLVDIAHYTQIVWKATKEVGLGIVKRGNHTYIVANYDPPGNFAEEFQENVSHRIPTEIQTGQKQILTSSSSIQQPNTNEKKQNVCTCTKTNFSPSTPSKEEESPILTPESEDKRCVTRQKNDFENDAPPVLTSNLENFKLSLPTAAVYDANGKKQNSCTCTNTNLNPPTPSQKEESPILRSESENKPSAKGQNNVFENDAPPVLTSNLENIKLSLPTAAVYDDPSALPPMKKEITSDDFVMENGGHCACPSNTNREATSMENEAVIQYISCALKKYVLELGSNLSSTTASNDADPQYSSITQSACDKFMNIIKDVCLHQKSKDKLANLGENKMSSSVPSPDGNMNLPTSPEETEAIIHQLCCALENFTLQSESVENKCFQSNEQEDSPVRQASSMCNSSNPPVKKVKLSFSCPEDNETIEQPFCDQFQSSPMKKSIPLQASKPCLKSCASFPSSFNNGDEKLERVNLQSCDNLNRTSPRSISFRQKLEAAETSVEKEDALGKDANFNHKILCYHNVYRAQHGVPPLVLDAELTAYAEEWAQCLSLIGELVPRPKNIYGENLYRTPQTDPDAYKIVEKWYAPNCYYNYAHPELVRSIGTFSQMIWKDTKYLGVGMTQSQEGAYVVAYYSPRGNFIGKYRENVLPPLKKI